VNRAPELRLRQRRERILDRFPCLASKDEQAVRDCVFSEYGALDAYVELADIGDALERLSVTA
jgi:hypothetical protein